MSKLRIALSLILLLGLLSFDVVAETAIPKLTGPVIDTTGVLGPVKAELEQKLTALKNQKGSEVVVLVVPSVKPESIEQYSIRVVDQWQLGRKKVDDGILILLALEDRETRIEVGRGLEGDMTDLKSKRIIDEQMIPHFKSGDIPGGIVAAVDTISAVLNGAELPDPSPQNQDSFSDIFFNIFIGCFIGGMALRAILGKFWGATIVSVIAATIALFYIPVLFACLFALFLWVVVYGASGSSGGGSGRGGYYSSGGSSWGGGGSFGGGGASGRW